MRAAAGNTLNLEAVPLHSEVEGVFLVAGLVLDDGSQEPLTGSFFRYPRCLRLHRISKIS